MSKIQKMNFEGSANKLQQELGDLCPEIPQFPTVKRKMLDYQLMALYILAQKYNWLGSRILEIGTGHGASGYMLAKAAPLAQIVSLTISPAESAVAKELWRKGGCNNITGIVEASWDYLARTDGRVMVDMVFVDGDHNNIARDLPWFNRLSIGGLLLCHDYSGERSRTPSPIVYAELNLLSVRLHREFEVMIVDDGGVGMVGFFRQEGEMA